MFSKTEFKESNLFPIQLPKGLISHKKKRIFSNIGIKSTPSNSNSKKPKIFLHTPSMTDLPLPPEHLTTDTSQPVLSRTLSVDMHLKLVITFPEDLVGIVMVCQFSTK